jgi:hypothetical protein
MTVRSTEAYVLAPQVLLELKEEPIIGCKASHQEYRLVSGHRGKLGASPSDLPKYEQRRFVFGARLLS